MASRLEQRALDYRRHMFRSGIVVLHHISEKQDENKELVIDTVFEYRITFDNNKIRLGWRGQRPGGPWGSINWTILNQEKYISDPRRDAAVLIARQDEYEDIRGHFQIFRPQALGMSVNDPSQLAKDDLGRLLNRVDRKPTAVAKDMIDGISTWRIDYEVADPDAAKVHDWKASVWIAPSQGDGLLRGRESFIQDGVNYAVEVQSKLKQYPDGGIWYPAETVTSLVDNGKLFYRNTVQVRDAEFNVEIDPDEFTLKGLDLKVGRGIADRSEGPARGLEWDGEKAVGISAEEVRLQEAALERKENYEAPPVDWGGMFTVFGIFLLVGAAGLFGWNALEARREH